MVVAAEPEDADAERKLLDPIAPLTLPQLTHADAELDLDYTGAGIGQGSLGQTFTYMALVRGEVPLTTRAWHAGLAWDVVSAAAEGRGRALLYGNPEVWVRGVGWHESGLAVGGGLGVVIPLPRDVDGGELEVLDTVRVIRPWDSQYFESTTVSLRPSFDARLVLPPFVLQIRQGLDWSYNFDEARSNILARTGTSLMVQPLSFITGSIEVWQTYSITHEIKDDQRAAFSMSPGIRVRLKTVEPGLSVLFPINTPLQGIATEYVAVRLHVRLALGDTAPIR